MAENDYMIIKLRPFFLSVVAFFLMLSVGGAIIYLSERRYSDKHRQVLRESGTVRAHLLKEHLDRSLSSTFALASVLRQSGKIDNFDTLASEIIKSYGGITNLQLAPNGVVTKIYPLAGNEAAIGHDLLNDPQRRTEALAAIESRKLTLAGPFTLLQGGVAVIGRLPVFIPDAAGGERFWGFTNALINLPDLIARSDLNRLIEGAYDYELSRIDPENGTRIVFARSSDTDLQDGIPFEMIVPNGTWTLTAAPTGGWRFSSLLPLGIALAVLASTLVAFLTYKILRQPEILRREVNLRTHELAQTNRDLGAEIIERMQAESALRQSQEHLRLLLETTSAIPWEASAENWLFTYVGPQAARVMGYPVDEWYQKDFWTDHIHPEDRQYAIDFCLNSSSRLRDFEFEYRMIKSDGSIVWLHDIVSVESMNGVPKILRGFMIDITERKLEAKQIQRKSKELSTLHDFNLAVTSTLDLQKVLNLLVEKTTQLLPYSGLFLSLYNHDKRELELIVSRNFYTSELTESLRRIGGKSFAQKIFETKTPIVVKNLQTDPRVRDPEFARRHGLKSYIGVPLMVRGEALGVFGFHTKEEHDFTGGEVEFLSTLASQAAIAIHNSQLYENIAEKTTELQKANQQLSVLYSVSSTISNSLETDLALSSGMRKVQEIFGFESARIYLFDEKEGELRLLANEGSPDGFVPSSSIKPGKGALGKVFEEGRLIYFEDIQTDPNYLQLTPSGKALKAGFRGSLSIPIKAKNKVTGVMNFSSKSPHRFTAAEVQLLESIANNFGTVIENLYLFQEVRSRSEELQKSGEELQRLTGSLLSAQEDERRRLARELHDDLTQRLAVLAIEAGKMEQQFDTSPDLIRERLPAMKDQIVALSTDIHRISRQLHPSILDDLGLVDAIKSLCTGFSEQEGIPVEFTPENLPEDLTNDLSLCLYRITQESLRNIAKHAQAQEARVTLAGNNGSVLLSIQDSGVGFDPAQVRGKPGLGLASMEERVRLIQGSLSVQSQPTQGTTIEVRAPLARGDG